MRIIERDTGQEIWFEKSNPELFGLFLGSLIFVGLAILALNGGLSVQNTSKITLLVVSWTTIILFGLASLLYLRFLFVLPRWVVKITVSGFIDHRILRIEVPWSEVAAVEMFQVRYNSFVNVTFKPSFAGSAGLRRRLIFLFKSRGRKQVLISAVGLRATKAELLHSLQKFHERYTTNIPDDRAVLQTQERA